MNNGIMQFVSQNWLGTLIGVVGLIYAAYEARRRRGPRLAYQFTGQRLIGGQRDRLPNEVEILFRGVPVTNLSQTQIVVWNNGDAPLRRSDVPLHDPLTFSFGHEARVFLAEVAKCTREVNKSAVSYRAGESNEVYFSFDFLDEGDGALITVWHDGSDTMPDSTGTVLGQKEGPLSYGRFIMNRRNLSEPRRASNSLETLLLALSRSIAFGNLTGFMPFLMVFAGIFVVVSGFADKLHLPWANDKPPSDISRTLQVSMGALYALTGWWFYHATKRRFPKRLLPDEYLSSSHSKGEAALQ